MIIAEASTNHVHDDADTRFDLALEHVYVAAKAGADAIKFQIFDNPNSETMFCWIDGDEERSKRWAQSRLDLDKWKTIKQVCDGECITFLASVFEYETVKWLIELDVEATKVASRAAGNLEAFKDAPKPLLVSNGMYDVKERDDIIILECEANYPSTAIWKQNHPGYSDHSGKPLNAIHALANGCKLIEVHFRINDDPSPDLIASLSVEELKMVCDAL